MNMLRQMCADRPMSRLHLVGMLPEDPDPTLGGPGGDPAKPAPPAKVFTQAEMDTQLQAARERGERKAIADMAAKFGMSPDEAAAKFKELSDADKARLPELERREREAKEATAAAATATATATAQAAEAAAATRLSAIKGDLAEAGATGANLTDAAMLLAGSLAADADAAATKAAVEVLKTRRPELFTAPVVPDPTATPPSSDPGPGPTPRPSGVRSIDKGRAEARKHFGLPDPAKVTA